MTYMAPKSGGRGAATVSVIAESSGWQLQRNTGGKNYGFRFKVVDARDAWKRLPDKTQRRVFNVSYSRRFGAFTGDYAVLQDHYPVVALWAKEKIIAYCAKED